MSAPRAAWCAAALLLLVAACSNRESSANKRPHTGLGTASAVAGGGQLITITTGNDYRFHPSTVTVHPGSLTVVLKNTSPGGAPHDFKVDNVPKAYTGLAPAGTTVRTTFTVPGPGRYRFVCTIHTTQGQTGTLVVRPAP